MLFGVSYVCCGFVVSLMFAVSLRLFGVSLMLFVTSLMLFAVSLMWPRSDVHAAEAPGGPLQHVLRLPALQAGQEDPLERRHPGGGRAHPLPLLAALLLHHAYR